MFKVGLIGTGFIATHKHLPAWQRAAPLARVAALCDVDAARGEAVAREFGIPRTFTSVEAMLQEVRPDIVDICTPPRTHAALAVAALRAEAHVLIEKPMAVNTEECDAIIATAAETGKRVCVAHSDLFYPAFMQLRAQVGQGMIGEFRGMRIFLSTPMDYITSRPDHWAHGLPGGVLGETGPHIVYMTLAFINPIKEVSVHAQKLLPAYPWSPYEDYRINLIGEHAASSVTLTYATKHWAAQVEVWGSDGILRADLESQVVVRHDRRQLTPAAVGRSALSEAGQALQSILGTALRFKLNRIQNTHELLIQEFCRSIRDGSATPVTAQEGREAVRVMDTMAAQLEGVGV